MSGLPFGLTYLVTGGPGSRFSVQSTPLTDWVVGGIRGTIPQRSLLVALRDVFKTPGRLISREVSAGVV